RDFQGGLSDYSRAAYASAIDQFDNVIAKEPSSAAARFARAQTWLHMNDFDAAIQDLNRSYKAGVDGRISACLAYCYARQENYPNAILMGQEAIATGFATPAVFNNLGYSYFEKGRYHNAQECFDKAVELAPQMGVAYHNRI